jgi:anaerobic selenocysteine-containing dehydrogenase
VITLTRTKNRDLQFAARAYQAFHGEGIKYTAAREAVIAVAADTGETFSELRAFYLDSGNESLCETCGWTMGMICPECSRGCGCETRCSGWRHAEYTEPDPDDPESSGLVYSHEFQDYVYCGECGAGHEYECEC